ncbi:MAG: hypothetical protein MUC63_06445, partial [Planctomycetes bacterium]|nr:hypothetical protein [Planctomycetota bacterium]
ASHTRIRGAGRYAAARRARNEPAPASGEGVTDAAGELRIVFPTAREDRPRVFLVKAQAADVTGSVVEGQAVVFSGPSSLLVSLTPAGESFRPGAPALFRLRAWRPSRNPAAAEGAATLERKGGDAFETLWRRPVSVDATGAAPLDLGSLPEGEYRVRFETRDRRGTLVVAEEAFRVGGAEAAWALALSADRDSYVDGEIARIGVRGEGLRGAVLFTVEAEEVLDWRVVRPAGSGEVLIPIRESFAPNALARVAVPGTDRLLEGECEIRVSRKIEVALEPDRKDYAPGALAAVTLRATDARGRPAKAEFSVAAVDEALLRLEPDRTPEIFGHFFHFRRVCDVSASSSCGFSWTSEAAAADADLLRELETQQGHADRKVVVLEKEAAVEVLTEDNEIGIGGGEGGTSGGRFGGRRNLRAYGGGRRTESGLTETPADRTLFLPAAFWDAGVRTGADGKARVEFRLPDDLTTWKVTARGCGTGASFGEGSASFAAAKPLSVELDLPPFVAEGDRFRATAVVRSAQPEEAVRVEIAAKGASGDGPTASVACGGERAGLLAAEFAAGAGAPFLEVRAEARGRAGADAVSVRVPVRPAGNAVVRGFGGLAAPRASHSFLLPTNRIRGGDRLRVRIDPGLKFCIDEALRDLEEFPYGCVEQTVNRFVPSVAALDAYRALGLSDPALEARFRAMADRGLELLYGHQQGNGAFGWWGGGGRREGDLLMTSYAFLAMALCRARDVRVDDGCFGRARDALLALARARGADPDLRAFGLYALSVAGAAPEEDLLLAASRRRDLSPAGAAVLSLALRAAGRGAMAREFAESLAAGAEAGWDARRGFASGPEEAAGWAVLAMVRAGLEGGSVEAGVRRILQSRRGGRWCSTRATGAAVMALSAHLERFREGAPASRVRVFLNGAEIRSAALDAGAGPVEAEAPAGALRDGENRLEVAAEGRAVFFSGEVAWRASEPPAGDAKLLTVAREYCALSPAEADDARIAEVSGPANGWNPRLVRARPGDRVFVRLVLKPSEDLSYVVVEDPVPGGAEVVGPVEGAGIEAFEDRGTHAAIFLSKVPREGAEIVYALSAVRAGRFAAAPVRAEPMYRPEGLAFGLDAVAEIHESVERPPGPAATAREADGAFAGGRFGDAAALFERLLAFPLREEVRLRSLERLLDASLELDRPEAAVRAYAALA